MAGVAVAASRASRGRSSSLWCSCARGPRSPSAPASGAGPPSRFPHSQMPAVSVSQGSPPAPPSLLLKSGSLANCMAGLSLQILQRHPHGLQTCRCGCSEDVLNVRIGIFYVQENVRRPFTKGQNFHPIPTCHEHFQTRREDERKIW